MSCIEARGLRKAFGTTIAVDGVDLRVEEGRILGLIGPHGAGKTTTLDAMLGLTPGQRELIYRIGILTDFVTLLLAPISRTCRRAEAGTIGVPNGG